MIELDCRGLPCPLPVIELSKVIETVEIGEIVAVIADDAAAATDIPAWCRMKGQEYLSDVSEPDEIPRYLVRRVG